MALGEICERSHCLGHARLAGPLRASAVALCGLHPCAAEASWASELCLCAQPSGGARRLGAMEAELSLMLVLLHWRCAGRLR
jgi:hypothetical protein